LILRRCRVISNAKIINKHKAIEIRRPEHMGERLKSEKGSFGTALFISQIN